MYIVEQKRVILDRRGKSQTKKEKLLFEYRPKAKDKIKGCGTTTTLTNKVIAKVHPMAVKEIAGLREQIKYHDAYKRGVRDSSGCN